MKKRNMWLAALLIFTIIGCAKKEPKPLRVVTEITVTCEGCASLSRRYYNTEEKMQMVLTHIRGIGLQDTPQEDPDAISGRLIHINLTFSDGSRKVYSLKSNRFFREGNGPWKEISSEKVSELYLQILLTPSDEEPPHLYRPHPIGIQKAGNLPL